MKIKLYKCFEHWYHGGTIWVISDTHFQKDTEMEQFFGWPSAEDRLKAINECITKNDTLIHLGDVGDRLDLISKIKCDYKVLITGNHDKGNRNYSRVKHFPVVYVDTFEDGQSVLKTRTYVGGTSSNPKIVKVPDKYFDLNIRLLEDCKRWEVFADNHLFDEIYDGPLFINDKLLLSHEKIELPFVINIHGHHHCAEEVICQNSLDGYNINCASDMINFTPVRLDALLTTVPQNKVKSIHDITIEKATEKKK